jgi:RNA polymerase primary sigma factor
LLAREEEAELSNRIQAGDADARERMIKGNLRLVVKIASEFDGYGVPLLDLISEGNIGLMKAADRFDPSHGAKFSTYAAWWIKQGIRRALANQARTVRMPVHAQEKLMRISRVAAALQEELGRDPTDAELASEVGLPEKKVRRLRAASQRPLSLDEPAFDDRTRTVADIVADESVQPANQRQDDEETLALMLEAFDNLDPREQQVLRSRFGLEGEQEQTLETIGTEIGITREYVRQIQNRALSKMRRRIAAHEELVPIS